MGTADLPRQPTEVITTMTKKKKPLSERARKRVAHIRRDPFGRLTLEINRYLKTVGWRALVIGTPQVRGYETKGLGHYELAVSFSGGRIQKAKAE